MTYLATFEPKISWEIQCYSPISAKGSVQNQYCVCLKRIDFYIHRAIQRISRKQNLLLCGLPVGKLCGTEAVIAAITGTRLPTKAYQRWKEEAMI